MSTHTHPFNGHFSGTTQVSRYQQGKTNLDFTEGRDSEWQWHQLGHMQVCISLQTDNHASTPLLSFFTGRMPFLPPNQQHQSTEGIKPWAHIKVITSVIVKWTYLPCADLYWFIETCYRCNLQLPSLQMISNKHTHPHTHTRLMALCPGLPGWAGTRKVKTNLNFTEARDSEWQWHQLGRMQVCTSLQADNDASTPPLSFLQARCPSWRPTNSVKALKAPDALPDAQPTVSKHW